MIRQSSGGRAKVSLNWATDASDWPNAGSDADKTSITPQIRVLIKGYRIPNCN
jgi:hypothetical protein